MPPEPTTPPANSQPASHLGADEECEICVVRKHPIGIIMVYVQGIVGLAVAFALLLVLIPQALPNFTDHGRHVLIALAVIIAALVSLLLTIATALYYASKLFISNQKLTEIYQQGLFRRQTSRLSLADVEDVSADKNGVLATLFNFGTLKIETAGEEENFHFRYCPKPEYYAKIVLDARAEFNRTHHVHEP